MKNFNNYKLSKNDKQIIKNFKLDREYKVLTKDELDAYWCKILNLTVDNKEIKLKNFYKPLLDMKGYISIINGIEYFFLITTKSVFIIYFFIILMI